MAAEIVLGIDCGGTHTDAALLEADRLSGKARLLGSAKTITRHEALEESVRLVLEKLATLPDAAKMLPAASRVTLGTTLAVNALVQGKGDKVGLALSAGPGLNPEHFVLGEDWCIVPGGLDHRGVEIGRLDLSGLKRLSAEWPEKGVQAAASAGKFSPRNPAHELEMAQTIKQASSLPVSCGHSLSGRLDFPRRIATAYYNASVQKLHKNFLDSVEASLRKCGITCAARLLRADGGAIPFHVSRKEPVQSILSGPAASVMGALAMWDGAREGCALLLDVGGTTTDIAVFLEGSPVVDRLGMRIAGRRTLVRSLASISIGIGGDSLIHADKSPDGSRQIKTGPIREGAAAAFGGIGPTLLDALNFLDNPLPDSGRGDIEASRNAIMRFGEVVPGLSPEECAKMAVADAMNSIANATEALFKEINAHPVYTIAALRQTRNLKPEKGCIAGGPAACLRERLETALQIPLSIAPHANVTNAIGAALTLPTASLEVYADTGKRELYAPTLDYREKIPSSFTLEDTRETARRLLAEKLKNDGMERETIEIASADMFATLDDRGHGARDMRVSCQARPGIVATLD